MNKRYIASFFLIVFYIAGTFSCKATPEPQNQNVNRSLTVSVREPEVRNDNSNPTIVQTSNVASLPAQYTVRPWNSTRDCLWNIAGQPWAYNDPAKWRLLYNANKSKLPDPNNPDLIEPGMIIDIPSINGEIRQGMYSNSLVYTNTEERRSVIGISTTAPSSTSSISASESYPLPAQYTVNNWNVSRDCLWNIAAQPWIYNDPRKWMILYNANKSKFPDPNNPNLIEPGMILDIPSISGEVRQGLWIEGRSYRRP